MKRMCVSALTALLVLGALSAASEAAETATRWRFAPAQVPPPPPGVPVASESVNVGPVGQISFWAPNRGLLIEGGTGALHNGTPAVPAGLYAYNGAAWHLLSDQCGGSEGRIAWAGPDEFWTISDQRGGQDLPEKQQGALWSVSLCHFLDGQIVASYAMPLDEPGSYLRMDAAACYSASDCWFGGTTGTGEDPGAFHLHWDGASASVVYNNEEAHAVTGMVNYDGQLLESVATQGSGLPGEPEHPAFFHTIAPVGQSFSDLYLFSPATGELLPEYEKEGPPYKPEGFRIATDALGIGGAEATQLWAVANQENERFRRSPTVLRCEGEACLTGQWSQLMPGTASLAGAEIDAAPAPEPGSADSWISLTSSGREGQAEVAQLGPQGVLQRIVLPEAGETEIGERGTAGPIACPAPNDCWMATSEGWLYHYTDGAPLPLDQDPSFAGVITNRPLDGGTVNIPLDGFAEEERAPPPVEPQRQPPAPTLTSHVVSKKIVKDVHDRFVHRNELVITFTLTGTARVSLVARRGRKLLARVGPRTLRRGRHTLSFNFNPSRPPTKLQFAAVAPGSGGGSGQESRGGSNTIET